MTAGAGRRLEDPIRFVAQALDAAEDADQAVHPVVEWGEIVVGDRPVGAQTIKIATTEVVGSEA